MTGPSTTATPPECQQVQACYAALSSDLCLFDDPACTTAFTVRRSLTDAGRCAQMLDRAQALAGVFAVGRSAYDLPAACRL